MSSAGVGVDPSERGTPRRFDIELLRVVAVVGVVLFHFAPGASLAPNGFLGVDVFFTISGFVITAQMLRAWERGRLSYPDFLARRVRRLLPSAVLVIVVTYAVVLASRNVVLIESQRSVAIAALLYASNFVFAGQAVDYFASVDAPSPFLHYWSLSVEEQFYLLWPILLIAVAVAVRRRPDRFLRAVLATALGLTVVSLVVAAVSMRTAPEQTFFMPWARAHQLLVGAAAAVLVALWARGEGRRAPGAGGRVWWPLPRPVLSALRIAAVGWLVLVQVAPFGDLPSPAPIALLVSLPVAFIAVTGSGRDLLERLGGWWPLEWTARLSYVIYLWHWPVWVLVLAEFGALRGRLQIALALAVTLVLAIATHHLVEKPFRDGRRIRALPPLRTAVLGLGASILAAVTVLGAAAFAPARPWQTAVRPAIAQLPQDKADVYERKCHVTGARTEVEICADGPADAARTVLTLGDSHAASWQPAFQALAREDGWRFQSVTKGACPAWDVPIYAPSAGGRHVTCEQWRRDAFALIERERPDVVILHSSEPWTHMLTGGGEKVTEPAPALSRAVTASVSAAQRSGATVVVMADTPSVGGRMPLQDCLATADDPAECNFETKIGHSKRAVMARAAERAGAIYVDPYPVVCPGEICQVVQNGVVVYRDGGHLTKTYVLGERGWVRSWLTPLLERSAG